MSGFFFCGMMLDPVDQASSRRTKPNSAVDQSTISSDSRLRSMPVIAVTNANSATKSRAAVPSIEFALESVKPELDGDRPGVEAEARAGEGAGAVRRVRGHPDVPVAQAVDVAEQRPGVGQEVVGQEHRLGVLEVGAAGHDDVEVVSGLDDEGVDEVEDPGGDDARLSRR